MYISKTDRAKKILKICLFTLIACFVACAAYIGISVSRIWAAPDFDASAAATDDFEIDANASGLEEVSGAVAAAQQQVEKPMESIDVLLLGVDNRNPSQFSGRSDVMMYLRIDTEKKSLKLVSLMRDTLIKMDGYSDNKLNTAYRFGSIDLAKQTISQNFGLAPDNYVIVNFYGMEDIIDALGGVDVNIKKKELRHLNDCIEEVNAKNKSNKSSKVKKYGEQHLNGRQAVAYMRIRHTGDGDEERIERQQAVLSQLFKKMNNISLDNITGLINMCIEYVRTDIPLPKMMEIAKAVKGMSISELEKFRYPNDYKTRSYKGMSVVVPRNSDTELAKLHDFLEQ